MLINKNIRDRCRNTVGGSLLKNGEFIFNRTSSRDFYGAWMFLQRNSMELMDD